MQEMKNKPYMTKNNQQIKKRKQPTFITITIGKCLATGKMNSIDNQRVTLKNT